MCTAIGGGGASGGNWLTDAGRKIHPFVDPLAAYQAKKAGPELTARVADPLGLFNKSPKPPAVPEPTPPPRQMRAPRIQQFTEENRRRYAGGGSQSTLLTGTAGVLSGLNLGTSALLGG